MRDAMQVVTVILVVLAMTPALAHALELPGKLRLTKEAYLVVQPIYYPGFTVAGFSEPLAIIAAGALLALTPARTADFWLTLAAAVALACMHAVYWLVTHPVNRFWLQDRDLAAAGAGFFEVGRERNPGANGWEALRDRWEYSHVARAALALVALVLLVTAIS